MDRRIDERFRKPRRTGGTPFHAQRNYWAAGAIAVSGLIWYLLELTPGVSKSKKWLLEHSENSEEYNTRLKHIQAAYFEPAVHTLLTKARERAAYKNEPDPSSSFYKFYIAMDKETSKRPDEDQ